MDEYGPFAGLVEIAGYLTSTIVALRFLIKGNTKWDPSEEDVPKGGLRVAGAVSILILVYMLLTKEEFDVLKTLYLLIPVLVLSTVVYGILINQYTYTKYRGSQPKKIIGGFVLTRYATEQMRIKSVLSIQQFFAGVQYEEDIVWPRISRGLAKGLFVFFYMVLIISLTTTIAFAAIAIQRNL